MVLESDKVKRDILGSPWGRVRQQRDSAMHINALLAICRFTA
jgi:hypothetical protein